MTADYLAGLTFYEKWGRHSVGEDVSMGLFGAAMAYGTYRVLKKTYQVLRD